MAVEDPGYLPVVALFTALFTALGANVVAVPVDGQGLVVDLLPSARVVYVTPSHQFPLGVTMSMPRRRALRRLGIKQKNGRPNHPQTQGETERFQQTLKKWLAAQHPQPADLARLQAQIDAFTSYYRPPHPKNRKPRTLMQVRGHSDVLRDHTG